MSVAKIFKQFSKMSEEEKADFMELISKDDVEEVAQDTKQIETQEPQVEEDKKVETQPEEKEQISETAKTIDDTNVEEKPQEAQEQEYQEQEQAIGIPIQDVALKSEIQAKFDAFEAKLDSLVKENKDLKEKLSKSQDEAKDLHNKYERDDFGNQAERNFGKVNKSNSYESADDYLKRFR